MSWCIYPLNIRSRYGGRYFAINCPLEPSYKGPNRPEATLCPVFLYYKTVKEEARGM